MTPGQPPRTAHPPPRPILLFDGNCPFCRWSVVQGRRRTGAAVDYESLQTAGGRFPELAPGDLIKWVHLVEPDGRVTRGGEAVLRTLALAPHRHGRTLLLGVYRRSRAFAWLTERVYDQIAGHRDSMMKLIGRLAPQSATEAREACDREGCGRQGSG